MKQHVFIYYFSNTCLICCQSLANGQDHVKLRQKGSDSINAANKVRLDNITFLPGQTVHVHCRKDYCNPIRIKLSLNKKPTQTVLSPSLRSNTERFNFSTNCLFCAQRAKFVGRKRGYNVYPVRTVEFKKNIEQICIDRDDK